MSRRSIPFTQLVANLSLSDDEQEPQHTFFPFFRFLLANICVGWGDSDSESESDGGYWTAEEFPSLRRVNSLRFIGGIPFSLSLFSLLLNSTL